MRGTEQSELVHVVRHHGISAKGRDMSSHNCQQLVNEAMDKVAVTSNLKDNYYHDVHPIVFTFQRTSLIDVLSLIKKKFRLPRYSSILAPGT